MARVADPRRSRRVAVVVVVALLALVNLPLVHGAWTDRQVRVAGVDVVAEVTATEDAPGPGGLVDFRFAPDVDPDQATWRAALEQPAFARAVDDGTVEVRVVPGDPRRYLVEGAQGTGLLLVLTGFADVVLLLALVLVVRRRGGGPLRLVALEDVTRARPGGRLEEVDEATYLVVGEVSVRELDAVVIDTGARSVRVELDGHANPVGYEQPAQVRARLPESGA
ncbi:hypothetical protein [Nocardioides litoris]|uniref:hypothetical protein n=1 Tax=Nocardioides litoris TaxID=1926648 RepID=UPI0014768A87|nr:hypothetical protein [Nocardioides litoris]